MRFVAPQTASDSSSSPAADRAPSSRRRFLFTFGAGTAGAAALTAAPIAAAAVSTPEPAEEAQASGYRETEHVRNYYRTAKL